MLEKRPKILLVDDEPFNIDYLEQELEDLDYETISARNGQEALDLVEAESPDMILLDIMMPVMDGFEVLSRLKGEKAWRDIPVVVISAMNDMNSIVKAIELGAEDYLPKPFDPILLQARLNAGLEKKRLRDLEHLYLRGLERELEIGREIQAGFLPNEIPEVDGWEIRPYFKAAREVAGDFYDVFHLPGGRIGMMLGDVCDKGVGSALYMALFRSLLRATSNINEFAHGLKINGLGYGSVNPIISAITITNNYICSVHQSAMFATIFLGVLDPLTGALQYINAGHEPPLIIHRGQIKTKLMPTGPVVGIIDDTDFSVGEIKLEINDLLLIYSDGVTDVQNTNGVMFEKERFLSILDHPVLSAESLINHIVSSVNTFIGGAVQFDDVTLLAVLRKS